ncbi:uncharacterized protein [Macrobrachium rosenbergii]|uniref:uncharacterized protein n=1 Tax=Macrobrachium rosenbergii TaxID=79674 RepID=UPI0034D6B570
MASHGDKGASHPRRCAGYAAGSHQDPATVPELSKTARVDLGNPRKHENQERFLEYSLNASKLVTPTVKDSKTLNEEYWISAWNPIILPSNENKHDKRTICLAGLTTHKDENLTLRDPMSKIIITAQTADSSDDFVMVDASTDEHESSGDAHDFITWVAPTTNEDINLPMKLILQPINIAPAINKGEDAITQDTDYIIKLEIPNTGKTEFDLSMGNFEINLQNKSKMTDEEEFSPARRNLIPSNSKNLLNCEMTDNKFQLWHLDTKVLLIVSNREEELAVFRRFATKNSSFFKGIEVFSINNFRTKQKFVFLFDRNKKIDDEDQMKFLVILHYANPSYSKRCLIDDGHAIISLGDQKYFYCIGNFENSSSDAVYLTQKVFNNTFLVVLRKDIYHPAINYKVLHWLAASNTEISTDEWNKLSMLNYTHIEFRGHEVLVTEVNKDQEESISSVLLKLKCDESNGHFIVCRKEYNHRLQYLMFITNCSMTLPKDDKILLLMMMHKRKIRENLQEICSKRTAVILDSMLLEKNETKSNYNQFDTKGCSGNQAEKFRCGINKLWDRGEQLYNFLVFPLLTEAKSPEETIITPKNFTECSSGYEHTDKEQSLKHCLYAIYSIDANPVYDVVGMNHVSNPDTVLASLKLTAKLYMRASLSSNSQCLHEIRNREFYIQKLYNSKGKLFLEAGPISDNLASSSCLSALPTDIVIDIGSSSKDQRATINRFWPTCSFDSLILFEERGMVIDWDYLTDACKLKEILLLLFSMLVTLGTILGNTLALAIISMKGLLRKPAFIILASMAIADLSMGIMPASLAAYDHISLMKGWLTLNQLHSDGIFADFKNLTLNQPKFFKQLRFGSQNPYHVLCSVVMSASAYISLFSLALFSIERLAVLRQRPLSKVCVSILVVIIWSLSITFAILVSWNRNNYSFVGHFDPVSKLTLNVAQGEFSVSSVTFFIFISTMTIAGICFLTLSVISVVIHLRHEHHAQSTLTIHQQGRKSCLRMTLVYILMMLLYLLANVPIILDAVFDLKHTHPVAHYVCWWLYVAGSSWNWALYIIRGKLFKEQAKSVLLDISSWLRWGLS